jgi:hypothetical protein
MANTLEDRISAYDTMYAEFEKIGLGSFVEEVKQAIIDSKSPAERTLALRNSATYQKRFAGNKQRVAKGLSALSEAEYIALEDQYQNVMRNYGLPESYWAKDSIGTQAGFTQLIAGGVDSTELESRIMTAKSRVLNANPEVKRALQQFYPDINDGDILGFVLDPTKGMDLIKRKVTAAEIGGAAMAAGLKTDVGKAEMLASSGVNKAQATSIYGDIASGLPRGSELAAIYNQTPYTQSTAEAELFKLSGQTEAEKERKKITGLEKATFGGGTGLTGTALARDRAGGY